MRIVDFSPPAIVYQPVRPVNEVDIGKIADALREQTSAKWTLREGEGEATPSLSEQAQQAQEAERQAVLESPLVKAAMEAFPDARLLDEGEAPNLDKTAESRSA